MITLRARQSTIGKTKTDLLAILVLEDKKLFEDQLAAVGKLSKDLSRALEATPFKGKEKETLLLYPEKLATKRLLLVGLGQRSFARSASTVCSRVYKSCKRPESRINCSNGAKP
jgi:hypothetical protein